MPRQTTVQNYNSLIAGLVTEGNLLSPPANAAKDILNFEILKTGGAKRRLGIDKEDTASTGPQIGSSSFQGTQVWDWDAAGGDTDNNFVVTRVGQFLFIFPKGADDNLLDAGSTTIALTSFFHISSTGSNELPIKVTPINGALVVTAVFLRPFIITYDGSTFYTRNFEINIRDFEGLDDGLDIDENPSVITFDLSSGSGTFTYNETVTGGTSGATARVIKDLGGGVGDDIYVDDVVGTFQVGENITGGSSGATGQYDGQSGDGLSDEHRYNLLNQGWTQTHMDTYAQDTGTWPNNTQVWYQGRDASNNFSPAELDKLSFGNTPAPKGHFILEENDRDYASVSGISGLSSVTLIRGLAATGSYAGRVWFAGWDAAQQKSRIYFTQIVTKLRSDEELTSDNPLSEIIACHQKNDPTAEFENELLATDGGFVTIPEMSRVVHLEPLDIGILVFATNGVWMITGGDIQSGFRADEFSQDKITSEGCDSPDSIVKVGESVLYWGKSGIFLLGSNATGQLSASNITSNISSVYEEIPVSHKSSVTGFYDSSDTEKKVYWAYAKNSASDKRARNKLLVFDLVLNAFYPYELGAPDATELENPFIGGFTKDFFRDYSSGSAPLKVFIFKSTTVFQTNWAEFRDTTFVDYAFDGGDEVLPYIETWPDTLGDFSRKKEAPWVFTYMKKTEDGFESDGSGGFQATNQSGLTMQPRWSWHTTDAGGKLGTARQIYRARRTYVPSGLSDPHDTGETVRMAKSKAYGRGMALGLYFQGESQKNAVLLGYSIPYTVDGTP